MCPYQCCNDTAVVSDRLYGRHCSGSAWPPSRRDPRPPCEVGVGLVWCSSILASRFPEEVSDRGFTVSTATSEPVSCRGRCAVSGGDDCGGVRRCCVR